MTIFGPDGASFQGDINWAEVDSSCDFGWEKVTQSVGYVNPRWAAAKPAMLARAKATGFVPGAYLFLEHGATGAAQAEAFARSAGDLTGFAIAIDGEPTTMQGGGQSRPRITDVNACALRLRELYPHHPIGGYLPEWYWGPVADFGDIDWLWASRYVNGSASPERLYADVPGTWWAPYGGLAITLLQFSSLGIVPGVSGGCDVSAYRGTAAELADLILPASAKPPRPPGPSDWQEQMMRRLPTLRQGDPRHDHVKRAQALVNAAHTSPVLAEDGQFGVNTELAVKQLQRAHGLTADGLVGPDTWTLLVTGAP